MQLTVFGASGKVGQQVVAGALADSYSVSAFVHSHNPFTESDKLTVITGDVVNEQAIYKALQGSQAVISTLGSWGTKDKNVLTTGMKTIIPAMEKIGISRLVTLTGSGALWSRDRPGLFDKSSHILLGLIAPEILHDGEAHLRLLEDSQLVWTCVRAPVIKNKGKKDYQLGLKLPSLFATVPVSAVARCLIDQIEHTEYIHQAPIVRHA